MRNASLTFALFACLVACARQPGPRTGAAPLRIPPTPAAKKASITLTRFPARAKPGEAIECEGSITMPPSLESRYTPRLTILLNGVSANQIRITQVKPGGGGPATFTRAFRAPDRPGKYDLVASFTVVPPVDPSLPTEERAAVPETVVDSPKYPMEVAMP